MVIKQNIITMMNNIKAIIFDMDGVIFNTENLWRDADRLANIKYNLDLDDDYRKSLCGKSEELIKIEFKNMFPNLNVEEYRKYIHDYVNKEVDNNHFEIKEGFLELIDYLKNNNYKIALASSSTRLRIEKLFKLKNINLDIFDYIVTGDDVGKLGKPNPYIFNLVSKYFNIESKNIIVLEDSLNGIEASIKGGFISIMVKDLIEPNDYAINNCNKIFDNLFEVIDYLKNNK